MSVLAKQMRHGAAWLALLAAAQPARAEAVAATGGWVADFSPPIMETAQRNTTVFQFEGSYKLLASGQPEVYLLISCVGMEAATRISANEIRTRGDGRCELKDRQGDKLLAAMKTAFDGFTLELQGGTGKWAGARGRLVSKETFTLESERQLKGFSNMTGELESGAGGPP